MLAKGNMFQPTDRYGIIQAEIFSGSGGPSDHVQKKIVLDFRVLASLYILCPSSFDRLCRKVPEG